MKKFAFTALLVVFAGCGRDTRNSANPAPGSTPAEWSTTAATDRAVPLARNAMATSTADPVLPVIAIEDAFATANEAVKRSCARALAAYQIGDYHGAVQEFESFADNANLTSDQKQLVKDALLKAQEMAAVTADSLATPRPSAPAKGNDASPPAIPDPALQESIARAEIASRIGDYSKAMAELTDIAGSPRLTADQKRTVQRMLSEARMNLPQAPNNAANPPVKK